VVVTDRAILYHAAPGGVYQTAPDGSVPRCAGWICTSRAARYVPGAPDDVYQPRRAICTTELNWVVAIV